MRRCRFLPLNNGGRSADVRWRKHAVSHTRFSTVKALRIKAGMLLFALVGSTLIAGCDSSNNDGGTPPAVLSARVFSLQTDLFAPAAKDAQLKSNFLAAAFRVWPVSVIIGANLIVPAAVTGAALEDTPEFIDGAWEWATTATVEGSDVEFALSARPSGSTIDWSMRISGTDPEGGETYDGFELYTATTTVGEQAGTWNLYYRIAGVRANVLTADFDVNESDDTATVTYRVPATAAEHAGDSVQYESDGDTRRFIWNQVAEALTHDVEWSAATGEGSIEATNYNGGVKGCWDASLEDVACSQ